MPLPLPEYKERLTSRQATLATLERHSLRLSQLRLAIAGAAALILIRGGLAHAAWVLVPAASFVATVFVQARLLNRRDRVRSAIAFYERGLARMAGRWAGGGRTGDRFRPADHPYADGLDLFGRGTTFDLLATVRTDAGEETLAHWLLAPAPPDVARARQEAVRDLMPRLDLRESVAVMGDVVRVTVNASSLRVWAMSPSVLSGAGTRWLFVGLVLASFAAIAGWAMSVLVGAVMLAVLGVQGLVAMWFRTRVHDVIHAVDEPSRELDVLAGLLRILEHESFESPLLRQLQQSLGGHTSPASVEIQRLSRSVALLSSRENLLFALPGALVLWTTQWAFAVEAWRARAGARLPRWLDVVGELDALAAFATFAAEHPDYAFPEFVDGPAQLSANGVAHPVLSPGAVANDVSLGGPAPRLLIVSGSNMSGKSTFLRALGVNVVLANAGAPVRATRFQLSSLHVGAAINVQDSLTDGRSHFFAEVRRVKDVVDLARVGAGHVLFLFDELLAGTNSHDRRIGAEAILSGLVAAGAIGLATTHDLALGEIVDRLAPAAANVHFEDRFENGALIFDYLIKPGIVRTSNAIALMQSIGLDV